MAQSNGFIISEVDEEDKPMLITNGNHVHHNGKITKNGGVVGCETSSSSGGATPGITALINRQLQGKFTKRPNAYRNRKPWYLS